MTKLVLNKLYYRKSSNYILKYLSFKLEEDLVKNLIINYFRKIIANFGIV